MPWKPTEQCKRFIQNVALGMTQTQAARSAGYAFPTVEGHQLMKRPEVVAAIREEQGKYEHKANMSRKKVMDGLLEAVDIARTMSEPASMVAAWREVAKICGYYAPETKQINLSINGAVQVSQIENMSDEELVKAILEGESVRVEDDDTVSEDPQVALLPAPSDDDGSDSDQT